MPVRPSPRKADRIPHYGPPAPPTSPARELLKSDAFRAACRLEGVDPTLRQARAYKAGRGRWGR